MSKNQTVMQAPKGVSGEAVIEGHTYEIPKNGKIKVVSDEHIETLKRHGFEFSVDEMTKEELADKIDQTEDKDELVEFIEERGGTADNDMGFKKLKRLAREAAGIEE